MAHLVIAVNVVDPWVAPPAMAMLKRLLRFVAHGNSNSGDNFFVVD